MKKIKLNNLEAELLNIHLDLELKDNDTVTVFLSQEQINEYYNIAIEKDSLELATKLLAKYEGTDIVEAEIKIYENNYLI